MVIYGLKELFMIFRLKVTYKTYYARDRFLATNIKR